MQEAPASRLRAYGESMATSDCGGNLSSDGDDDNLSCVPWWRQKEQSELERMPSGVIVLTISGTGK